MRLRLSLSSNRRHMFGVRSSSGVDQVRSRLSGVRGSVCIGVGCGGCGVDGGGLLGVVCGGMFCDGVRVRVLMVGSSSLRSA